MIAKAMSHEPSILFLDEPTAGVDVELRQSLWKTLYNLKKNGVTIFLTTHYIEEAERLADRVGIIHHGEILMIEKKDKILEKLGEKRVVITINKSLKNLENLFTKYNFKKNKIIWVSNGTTTCHVKLISLFNNINLSLNSTLNLSFLV